MEILKNLKKQIALLLLLISSFTSNTLFAQCNAPTNFGEVIQQRTQSSITVKWSAVTGAQGYKLFLYESSRVNPTPVDSQSVVNNITTATFRGLEINKTYYVRIVTICPNEVSAFSQFLRVQTASGPLIVDEVAMLNGTSNIVTSGSTNSISLKPECNELVSPTLRTPATTTDSFTINNATNKKAYRVEIYSGNELKLKLTLIREGDNKFVVKNEQCRIPSAGKKQVENFKWEYSDKYIIESVGNGNILIKAKASGHNIKVYEANSIRVSSSINNTSPSRN